MKRILKENTKYIILLFIIVISTFLIGCDAIIPTTKRVYNTDTGIDYDTIQEAIDAALSGEIIIVYPGTYKENIEFDDRNITVQSTDPLDSNIVTTTVIDGGSYDSVVQFLDGDMSTLKGFTIRNGDAERGSGIYVEDSSPTIKNNTITGNNASYGGGGIYVTTFSSPDISGNTITKNNTRYGGGIYVSNSSPTIENNNISDNTASYIYGDGGGIVVTNFSSPTIKNNTITDNTSGNGGGIYVTTFSYPDISGNTITGNNASYGGGIFLDSTSPTISNNTISNNQAEYDGGGIYVYICSNSTITGNTITGNTATNVGGGIVVNFSNSTITDNTIEDNIANTYGGGIYVSWDSDLLPVTARPTGWGTGRENIPTGEPLVPTEGVVYTIAGNEFVGNEHGDPLAYTESAHVYFGN